MRNPWFGLAVDAWSLGIEASAVIGLRTMKLAAGDKSAADEAALMVREKVDSLFALQAAALTGGLGVSAHGATRKTLAHYRRKVRANSRRLKR